MKHALIITLSCILFNSYSFAQNEWQWMNTNQSNHLSRIDFPSEQVGYVLPENGAIIKTTDGGLTWDSLSSLNIISSALYRSEIWFVNNDTGFVSTHNNSGRLELLRTKDGGEVWENVSPSDSISGRMTIQFIDENTGYAYLNSNFDDRLWRTIDQGQSWVEILLNFTLGSGTGVIPSLHVVSSQELYLVGGDNSFNYRGAIAKTIDGGQNWTTTYLNSNYSLIESVHFPNVDTGYVITYRGDVYASYDAGNNWDVVSTIEGAPDNGRIKFLNGTTGLVVANGNGYLTTDAGKTWTYDVGAFMILSDVDILSKDVIYGVGRNGLFIKRSQPLSIGEFDEVSIFSIYPNPVVDQLSIVMSTGFSETIVIYNSSGIEIHQANLSGSKIIDVSMWDKGLYIIDLSLKNGAHYQKKFIKQ
jgi:photosystem II stability/assembly factor-like uncharacterized protein